MYRHLLSLLIVLALQAPTHLFSVERTDIIVRKNTSVLLTKVLSPVKQHGFLVFDLNRVYLDEGAKLYLDAPAEIHARSVELRPGSVIATLGNPIRIHTEVFIPGDRGEDFWSFDYTKKISRMGSIDTRHRANHDGVDHPAGLAGRRGGDAGRDAGVRAVMRSSPLAGKGGNGKRGKDGPHGRSAGAITLNVKLFQGGYFMAPGGDGGDGGLGGNGGHGGTGYIDLRKSENYLKANTEAFPFLDAGRGGAGGAGGHGGNGGYGGRIAIRHEVMSAHALEAFFYTNSGGAAGLGGLGGLPGRGGLPGMVSLGGESDWRKSSVRVGKPGTDGQMGAKGNNGKKGIDGGTPGMERRQYETSR